MLQNWSLHYFLRFIKIQDQLAQKIHNFEVCFKIYCIRYYWLNCVETGKSLMCCTQGNLDHFNKVLLWLHQSTRKIYCSAPELEDWEFCYFHHNRTPLKLILWAAFQVYPVSIASRFSNNLSQINPIILQSDSTILASLLRQHRWKDLIFFCSNYLILKTIKMTQTHFDYWN